MPSPTVQSPVRATQQMRLGWGDKSSGGSHSAIGPKGVTHLSLVVAVNCPKFWFLYPKHAYGDNLWGRLRQVGLSVVDEVRATGSAWSCGGRIDPEVEVEVLDDGEWREGWAYYGQRLDDGVVSRAGLLAADARAAAVREVPGSGAPTGGLTWFSPGAVAGQCEWVIVPSLRTALNRPEPTTF